MNSYDERAKDRADQREEPQAALEVLADLEIYS